MFTIFFLKVPPEKNYPHLKHPFPPKIPIWPKSLYKPEKSSVPPIVQGERVQAMVLLQYSFDAS